MSKKNGKIWVNVNEPLYDDIKGKEREKAQKEAEFEKLQDETVNANKLSVVLFLVAYLALSSVFLAGIVAMVFRTTVLNLVPGFQIYILNDIILLAFIWVVAWSFAVLVGTVIVSSMVGRALASMD